MNVLKKTKQRELILGILSDIKNPISSEEIYEIISKKMNNLALSTVYRNINLLTENSIIVKIYENGIAKYYLNQENHKHILECKKCHKKISLDTCPFEMIENTVLKNTGFIIDDDKVIKGYCKECK